MSLPNFAVEHLLQTNNNELPHWDIEIFRLKCLLLIAAVLWLVGLPWALSSRRRRPKQASTDNDHNSNNSSTPILRRNSSMHHIIPWFAGVSGFCGFAVTAFGLVFFLSPYNIATARRVYQTPLLTNAECQRIIDMAFDTADRNVQNLAAKVKLYQSIETDEEYEFDEEEELLLQDPAGWRKLRHNSYPTNDLNLVSDPFRVADQLWLRQICDERLAPILSRVYGIPPRSIQAKDMFVVRYDAETLRSKLAKHTDGGDISFTIFLNDDFDGGGTRFWNRHTQEAFALLQKNATSTVSDHKAMAGHLSTFPAQLEHEGYPTTAGRRMILVGFLNVLLTDEDGTTPTGLSWWASWGNLDWALLRIKDAYTDYDWTNHRLRMRVYRAIMMVDKWHEQFATHKLVPSLFRSDQLPTVIQSLEESFRESNSTVRARWLEGQLKKKYKKLLERMELEEEVDVSESKEELEQVEL